MLEVKVSAPLGAAILLAASVSWADKIEYTAYAYDDNANVSVSTTSFSLLKTLWQKTRMALDVGLDQTTIPPLQIDGVTGASRPARQSLSAFRKNRGQIIAGLQQDLGDNTELAASYYFSQEVDYSSQAGIVGLTQSFAEKNFTVTLSAQYTLDSVGEILANGKLYNRFKETHQTSISITQLLTPTSYVRMGADEMRNQGFLSDPYRKAVIPNAVNGLKDDTIQESVPDTRYRTAGWIEYNQYLTQLAGSFSVEYRYYLDDWNLNSNMVWFKLNKYITPNWVFSPQYRFYDQTGADFGSYAGGGSYHAPNDAKLGTFGTNFFGAGLTCYLRTFTRNHPTWDFLRSSSITAKYSRYWDDVPTDNYSSNVLETRLRFEF